VLVLADGYAPRYERKVDPRKGAITVQVEPIGPAPEDPRRVLRGRVVDEKGKPVPGAIVSSLSVHRDKGGYGMWGAVEGLDPHAISDTEGVFRICHAEPVDRIGVEVRAPGLAPRSVELRTGSQPREVRLDPGATVAGRLVREGTGVASALVGLVQTDRSAGKFLGETTIGTDAEGRFVFNNIARGFEYAVYGKMASLIGRGATTTRTLKVDRQQVEVGDLPLAPGLTVKGRVVTTDGKKVPADIRAVLSADVAWDSQLCMLDAKGRFEFRSVPAGRYSLSIRIPGYRLSARNRSRLPTRPGTMEGCVAADIEDLVLEFEPGAMEWPRPTKAMWDRERQVRDRPLRGVASGRGVTHRSPGR